ncbi:MAG: hypothetical protein R3345_01380 [Fulvivirga sp.]|nr:hypothetical protein [Fulvivirga sp.]
MASLFPDYQYDIFISYRHNDNKYDGWVSEFVEKLRQELDATVKDKLSIYFDENPQDGLLETHNVDESINSKIKAVVFIPIISQTYCDTKSFAWQQEFLVFKNFSNTDNFGNNVKLANGNIASRILPVRIHDIDLDDTRLLEKELEGVLRSIDFIYRDAGVNRPLRPVDDEILIETRKPLYRNQINKVANAVKEIINGLKMQMDGSAPAVSKESVTHAEPVAVSSISTSLPRNLRVQVVSQQRPAVYLAWTSSDMKDQREEMAIILQKAGFNVYPSIDCPADDQLFKERVKEEIAKCDCSLHMLSGEFGRRFEIEDQVSFPEFQFKEAKTRIESNGDDFNVFIWDTNDDKEGVKEDQARFIKYIRNNITKNMMYSNSSGPMQLIDDMRVVMMKEQSKQLDTKDTDIFFIFNEQDEDFALQITDSIGNEYPVEIMNILPDGEDEYREISTQQIPKSKLAVVYFKYAADWALPFIKQVWKQIGGASSPTPLLLVGEDDPATNKARNFKAPKVVSTIVPKDSVSEEVKKVYTKVLELK